MYDGERLETIIIKLNDRLTIQEKELVHLRNKVETIEINDRVINHKMIIVIIKYYAGRTSEDAFYKIH